MTTHRVKNILNQKFERSESVLLPRYLKEYLNGERKLDEQLFSMLSFWLGHLEARLYKTSKRTGDSSYEMHIDRVLLFLEYAKEHAHKDGALIMASYRFLFPYADLYLKLKRKRIAVGEEGWSVTKRLTSVELKDIRVLLTIKSQLEQENVKLTSESARSCWSTYIERTQGKAPGKLATSNFHKRLEKYGRVFAYLQELERSWQPLHSNDVATC